MNNSQANNRIAKNTIFLYGRLLFSVIVGLYTSRLVLRNLGVEDYGIYNLVGGFVSLLAIFTFSINGTSQRFIVFELGRDDKRKLSDTFCTISVILIFFSGIFFLLAGSIGTLIISYYLNIPSEKLNIAIIVYFCSLVVFCLQLLAVPYTSLVIAHERMDFYALMSILETLAKLIVVISISVVSFNKLVYYAVALAIISIIVRFVYSLYCKRYFEESRLRWVVKREILKKVTSFTMWVGLGSFAGLLKDQGGNILINLFFGVTLNAACGIATQVRANISQLSSNIGLAISPQITKSYSSGDVGRSIRLTFFLAKAQTMLMLLFALPIIIETPRLLQLWLGLVPDYTVVFTRVVLILGVIQTLEMSYGTLFLAIGRMKNFQIIASVITLTVLPATYFCYSIDLPPFSYYLVCISIEIVLFLFNYYYLMRIISFPLILFIKEVVAKIAITCVVPVFVVTILQEYVETIHPNFLQMIINISMCMIIYIFIAFLYCLDAKERSAVICFILSKIRHNDKGFKENHFEN